MESIERLTRMAATAPGDPEAQRYLNRAMERHQLKPEFTIVNQTVQSMWQDRSERRNRTRTSCIYFFPQGETIFEQLYNRRLRPVEMFRQLLPQVYERLGLPYKKGLVRWSQKAGCMMCSCSPGFLAYPIYQKVDGFNEQVDVYVTIAAVPKETT